MRLFCIVLLYVALVASNAFGQTVFTPSPMDFKQNERLDALEKQIERLDIIESELFDIKESQAQILVKLEEPAKPQPTVVVAPVKVTVPEKPVIKPVSNGLYSTEELRAIYYKEWPNGYRVRAADVSPRSQVWNHLTSGAHRFLPEQVQGLTQSEALGIHDLHHAGLIRAQQGSYRGGTIVTVSSTQKTYNTIKSVPPQAVDTGCANGQCARRPIQSSFRILRR
jgi:hypothetical protein